MAVVEEGSDSYLRLELPFERAWASVAKALQSSGFEITDRNRSEGTYYLNYRGEVDGEESSGWFGWLGGDDEDKHPLTGVPLLMTMAEASASTVIIRLATEEGRSASSEDLLTLLQLVKGNIN